MRGTPRLPACLPVSAPRSATQPCWSSELRQRHPGRQHGINSLGCLPPRPPCPARPSISRAELLPPLAPPHLLGRSAYRRCLAGLQAGLPRLPAACGADGEA